MADDVPMNMKAPEVSEEQARKMWPKSCEGCFLFSKQWPNDDSAPSVRMAKNAGAIDPITLDEIKAHQKAMAEESDRLAAAQKPIRDRVNDDQVRREALTAAATRCGDCPKKATELVCSKCGKTIEELWAYDYQPDGSARHQVCPTPEPIEELQAEKHKAWPLRCRSCLFCVWKNPAFSGQCRYGPPTRDGYPDIRLDSDWCAQWQEKGAHTPPSLIQDEIAAAAVIAGTHPVGCTCSKCFVVAEPKRTVDPQ